MNPLSQTASTTWPIYRARRYTRRLATSHYENFTVVSIALPRHLRQDFYNIYAWCRHADDLADEISDSAESLKRLSAFRTDTLILYAGKSPTHPINIALADTIARYGIPADPFLKLIDAFEQDQRIQRYGTYEALVDYCRRSADPVGHLVLYLGGYRDPDRQRLSDCTCTALQLANHWQDISRDLNQNRLYLPREDMDRFAVPEQQIIDRQFTPAFADLMKFQVDRARSLFKRGRALLPLVDRRLRSDIELFSAGGEAILDRIEAVGYNVLSQRPRLGKWDKIALVGKVLSRRWM